MNSNTQTSVRSAFISANGFGGFRSRYDEVFSSASFERIFVIKGGPGTGKSTLMRKVMNRYKGKVESITAVYCSSDPLSLDGIILTSKNSKIGLVDATAPHERDAVFPGVCDEILNLADGLRWESLSEYREKIFALASKKKDAYKSAYSFLTLSGNVRDIITPLYDNYSIYNWAESVVDEMLKTETPRKITPESIGFSSAFSKFGRSIREDMLPEKGDFIIRGDGFSEYISMRAISDILRRLSTDYTILSSPLSDDMIDVIITRKRKIYAGGMLRNSRVISSDKETMPINTISYLGTIIDMPDFISSSHDSSYRFLSRAYDESLDIATKYFKQASEHHFALEALYSTAMDFGKAENYYQHITSKIDALL